MPGSKGGFFGGLLEGVGAAVFGAQQKKQERERQDRQVVASLLLKGLDADPTRETAQAVLPKVAELFHEPAAHLFGIKVGKKGNDPLTSMVSGLVSAYPTREDIDKRAAQQKETEAGAAEKGRLDARAADEGHQLDRLRKEWQDPEIQQAFGGAEHFRDFLTDRGFFHQTKQPTPPQPGSKADYVQTAVDDFKVENGRPPTPAEHKSITLKALDEYTQKTKADDRLKETGAEAERARQVVARSGKDVRTISDDDWMKARQTAALELQQVERAQLANDRRRAAGGAGGAAGADTTSVLNHVLSTHFVGARPVPATANTPIKELAGRTPNAIYQSAITLYLENKEPAFGFGNQPGVKEARAMVEDVRGMLADATGVDSATAQAVYKADTSAMRTMVTKASAIDQASTAFLGNLDLAEKASAKVPRTMSRAVNKAWMTAVLQGSSAPGMSEFELYVYTAGREYARVATQQTGAAGLTDYATKATERLLSAAQSPTSFNATANAMRNDVNVVEDSFKNANRGLAERIALQSGPRVPPADPNNRLGLTPPR